MTVKMILAVDQGNAIGWSDGRLPWKLKADMARFKELTTGGTVIMGRKTWDGIPPQFRPLPGRRNIVLSREYYLGMIGSDVDIYSSLESALKPLSGQNVWIIGGASVYEEALNRQVVDEIHLTLVHTDSRADVRMTSDLAAWKRFVLHQRAKGINWEVDAHGRQWDGDVETSYLHFTRA